VYCLVRTFLVDSFGNFVSFIEHVCPHVRLFSSSVLVTFIVDDKLHNGEILCQNH